MDLDPIINTSDDENTYDDYDNRPIRPMDQDALNEALARLPILVDEEDAMNTTDPTRSTKTRRQPVLAYSTRRKNFSGMNISQSILNTSDTPMNNKRKITGCTPTNKLIKQIDARQELSQLKEDNRILDEGKAALQLECVLLKKAHENDLEVLKEKYQNEIDGLCEENRFQGEQFKALLTEKDQLLLQTNVELENLRNDHTMLLLEKETLEKIVEEYQLMKEEMKGKLMENEITIQNLRNDLENFIQTAAQKSSINARMPLKETSTDRSRLINKVPQTKTTTARLNKPIPSTTKPKFSVSTDEKKKNLSTDKPQINSIASTRFKQKVIPPK